MNPTPRDFWKMIWNRNLCLFIYKDTKSKKKFNRKTHAQKNFIHFNELRLHSIYGST